MKRGSISAALEKCPGKEHPLARLGHPSISQHVTAIVDSEKNFLLLFSFLLFPSSLAYSPQLSATQDHLI